MQIKDIKVATSKDCSRKQKNVIYCDEFCSTQVYNGFKVDGIERRKTESENELAGGELVVYATNQRVQELKRKSNNIELEK